MDNQERPDLPQKHITFWNTTQIAYCSNAMLQWPCLHRLVIEGSCTKKMANKYQTGLNSRQLQNRCQLSNYQTVKCRCQIGTKAWNHIYKLSCFALKSDKAFSILVCSLQIPQPLMSKTLLPVQLGHGRIQQFNYDLQASI